MNERIIELADKAIEDMPGAWNIPDEFCEKFAELIIQECVEHLESSVLVPNIEHSRTKTKCIRTIKEHFGVDS